MSTPRGPSASAGRQVPPRRRHRSRCVPVSARPSAAVRSR